MLLFFFFAVLWRILCKDCYFTYLAVLKSILEIKVVWIILKYDAFALMAPWSVGHMCMPIIQLGLLSIQSSATGAPHLLSLPAELLLEIFSYLSPQDLMHVSQIHPDLQQLALDGSLWTHLHPVRWATGRWQFFKPPDISNKVCLNLWALVIYT